MIIFDFDDTLYPTSEEMIQGKPPPTDSFAPSVANILETAYELDDHVVIVTNATVDWVRAKAPKCLGDITILSARQDQSPVEQWKKDAFQFIHEVFPQEEQILSIGDSQYERAAVLELKDKVLTKNVKLFDMPTCELLTTQLTSLEKELGAIHTHCGAVDLVFTQ